MGRPVEKLQKYLDPPSCVRGFFDDSDQSIERSPVDRHFLSNVNITPGRDNSAGSDLAPQECYYNRVDERGSSVEANYSLHSGTPNYGGIFGRNEINGNKKVAGKKRNDALPALGGFGQEEFREKSLDSSPTKAHFGKLFLLRLGVDCTPKFFA